MAAPITRPAAAPTDEELVGQVLSGAKDQYALLVRRHNQRLFRAARAILREDAEAEDVVQQAWVAAYHQLGAFRGEASLSTWLTRIAVNEALGRRRRAARAPHIMLVDDGDQMPTVERTPEDDAAARELRGLLEAHIDALPEHYRTVLVLRDVEELDTAATAACLGITEEAVRVRLHRARQLVQQRLAETIGASVAEVFRFDGERCDRIVAGVMGRL
jgi:RNA polymerase sigma-70 factor (ECF subfamily)